MKKFLCVLASGLIMSVASANGPGGSNGGGVSVTRPQQTGGYSSTTPFDQNLPSPVQYANTPSMERYAISERFESYITVAQNMRDYVTPMEYQNTYLPLKRLAAQAKIKIETYGPISQTAAASILELVKFVSNHEADLARLWDIEAFYYVATDLFQMTEELIRDVR